MRRLSILVVISALFFTCAPEDKSGIIDVNRPFNPWAIRSVLDLKPRMLTLALHERLWAAYSAETGNLYKVWKGKVDFGGAVYNTEHGPQPISIGDSYIQPEGKDNWTQNGAPLKTTYKGHKFVDGHVHLMYDLNLPNGSTVKVVEQPEVIETETTQIGLERKFMISDLPDGMSITKNIPIHSVSSLSNISSEGMLNLDQMNKEKFGDIEAFHGNAQLEIANSGETSISMMFVKDPLIKSEVVFDDEEANITLGESLLNKSDCRTCHNETRKTIGPAYVDVALKYRNNQENIDLLASKVKSGGSGVWGSQIMNAHPDLAMQDIKHMVSYIMDLDKKEEADLPPESSITAPEAQDYVFASKNKNDVMLPGVLVNFWRQELKTGKMGEFNFSKKPEFDGLTSTINHLDAELIWAGEDFVMQFDGYLKVPEDGVYELQIGSDDGSILYLGDELLIDNDGWHGTESKAASVALKEGFHPFKIEFFQGKGGKAMIFNWRKAGDNFVAIPAANLFHHKSEQEPAGIGENLMQKGVRVPGDGSALRDVHPSFNLSQARPNDFTPKVGGMDFLPDGRMVISTWDADGSVFILSNVESGDPTKIKVKRIAVGLAEPLGLKVVDGEIYVLQKQELTKLMDHNGDDMIDEFETVCNEWKVSANFHEFAFGLEYKDGYFYGALATAINPGGASTQPQIPDRGNLFKISKETGKMELVAHGLRTPNGIGQGMGGELFIADNQGDWLPSSKIMHVKEGAFYGSRSVDFAGTAGLKEKLPVVWLPQDEIGNSPSTPIGIEKGPYKNQLIHCEVTNGGVKRVFVEEVNGQLQGCLFRFIQGLEAGINRMVWGPDGALYVGGIGSNGNWQHSSKYWYGLQRLEYNNESTFEMLAVRAMSNGIEIEFTEALQEGDGWNPNDYLIQQWYYKPTEAYGGPKLDERTLPIKSVNVSEDRKKVFLELGGMKENHLVYVRLKKAFVSDQVHELWTTEAWYTMNEIPSGQNGFSSEQKTQSTLNALSASEAAGGWKLLFDGKSTDGWRNFKKETIGSSWIIDDEALHLNAVKDAEGNWAAVDGGDIISNGTYKNFDLKLEWKIGACGNSGIMYNVVEDDKYDHVWLTGPEMQVLDNTCHPDAQFETHRAGDLYDMIACNYETVKPAGQWNKVRIIIKDGHVQHWLNGRKVVEFQMFDDNWTKMIANSKFKDMPDFGLSEEGHLSLQDHRDPVWFRNIKIKEL